MTFTRAMELAMNELVTKASQTTSLVVSDLEVAVKQAGIATLADKALLAYLADTLMTARKLRSDLERIAG